MQHYGIRRDPSYLDPFTTISHGFPGFIELFSGNIGVSLPYHQKLLQMDPNNPFTRYWCAIDFALNNKIEDSINVLNSMIRDTPNMVFGKFALFLKNALQGNKEIALQYGNDDLKREAAPLEYLHIYMAWGYALIGEKDEAVDWLKKSLDFGLSPYPLLLKFETFHNVLKDHAGFHEYMAEIKKRSEQFVV